ncbi:MAG TPA: hypothetical protein PKZ74_00820 [Bacteroidales bacterium]|nr:hypothetical protein [Bacteroidales bacterium]
MRSQDNPFINQLQVLVISTRSHQHRIVKIRGIDPLLDRRVIIRDVDDLARGFPENTG